MRRGADLTAQREGLLALGVKPSRAYVDHGLTGTNRDRPGLREALAACREGDTMVVTKLDHLARSLPDACAIADELTVRQMRLKLGGSVPVGPQSFLIGAPPAGGDMVGELATTSRRGLSSRWERGQRGRRGRAG